MKKRGNTKVVRPVRCCHREQTGGFRRCRLPKETINLLQILQTFRHCSCPCFSSRQNLLLGREMSMWTSLARFRCTYSILFEMRFKHMQRISTVVKRKRCKHKRAVWDGDAVQHRAATFLFLFSSAANQQPLSSWFHWRWWLVSEMRNWVNLKTDKDEERTMWTELWCVSYMLSHFSFLIIIDRIHLLEEKRCF